MYVVKRIYAALFVTVFFLFFQDGLSAQNWVWAKTGTTPANQNAVASAVVADGAGSVYVTGNFNSPRLIFGSDTLHNSSSSASDIFLVKYNSAGVVSWAKSFGGQNYDEGNALCIDKSGNIILTGAFNSPSISFGTLTFSNQGGDDIFLVRLNSAGTVLWAQTAGGSGNDVANGVCVDRGNNICLTGSFDSPFILMSSGNLGNSSGITAPLIVKYDSTGFEKWAKAGTGSGGLHGNSGAGISSDSLSNFYITGGFSYPVIHFGTDSLVNMGITNLFLTKYDSLGNEVWAKTAGGANEDAATGVSTDRSGNVYITGGFNSPSITFGTHVLTNAGSTDLFVVKYSGAGSVLWAEGAGGSGLEEGTSISTDANGFAYVSGTFGSATLTLGTTNLSNAGIYNIFMAEYNWGGQVLWAKSSGGSGSDYGLSAYGDASGNAYISGYFESPSISFGTANLIAGGVSNLYVAKISGITGIESLPALASIVSVYPNPANARATFHIHPAVKSTYTLTLYNQFGQEVFHAEKIQEQEFNLACESFSSGIYFYCLRDEEQKPVGTGKLLIEK